LKKSFLLRIIDSYKIESSKKGGREISKKFESSHVFFPPNAKHFNNIKKSHKS